MCVGVEGGVHFEALEGFLGIQGYWPKNYRDTGYYCKYLKGYGIFGAILGICQILTKNNNIKIQK